VRRQSFPWVPRRRCIPIRRAALFIAAAAALVLAALPPAIVAARARFTDPEPTPIFVDRGGRYLSEYPEPSDSLGFWKVPLPIPHRIASAFIAVEDRRFRSHPGVDPKAFLRAAWRLVSRGKVEGGSTIAMQVARLQRPARRTVWNKLCESWTALFLTARYGRDAVLAQYLRLVPQGNRISGVAYSARRFFRKPLADLSWAEAAFLAAIPKSPSGMNPFSMEGFRAARERAGLVLSLLRQQGFIDDEAMTIASEQLFTMRMPVPEERPPFAVHYILRLIEDFASDPAAEIEKPVKTTLDWDVQILVQEKANEAMETWRPLGAGNIAIIAADVETGEILGYIGSDDYFDAEHKGSIDYATVSRSAGSPLKPFMYALGLQRGVFTPGSVVADIPIHIVSRGEEFVVRNHDGTHLGPLLYRKALANSRNVAAIRVLEEIGVREVYDFLSTLGFGDGKHPPEWYGYGLILGGLYVTLEELVTGYGILANGGMPFSLRFREAEGVPAGSGQGPIAGQGAGQEDLRAPVIDPYAARIISLFLSDPLARLPSFPRLQGLEIPFPVAIKTGTSQGWRDAWAVGYSTEYVVGVWIGHPDNESMNNLPGLEAAGVVRDIFLRLSPEAARGIDVRPFPAPDGAVPVLICPLSGKPAGPDCTERVTEYFRQGEIPRGVCDVHRRYTVDVRTGALPGPASRPGDIETRVFAVLRPEYAAWGASHGYGPPPAPEGNPFPTVDLSITSPPAGGRAIIDPSIPERFQSVTLHVVVDPPVSRIDWYVDGALHATSAYPYTARWILRRGTHSFQARVPGTSIVSDVVTFSVEE
jgi:penicillin-binding protein 1C